ncbi:MAG: response regulator transcription factor [Cocleimonas sp.]|nr:response regulator transcription factor [Cocleimonas sp.]
MKANVLIVDDDAHIREVIAFALEKADMQVEHAADGREALDVLQSNTTIDLIVLDINMPEMDGLELCRELRKTSQTPILFLSSRDDEIDRILGLELGGDDYVTKPFSPRELVARINAILKRIGPRTNTTKNKHIIQHGKLKIDDEQHAIWWDQQTVALTATEFAIIRQMARYPNKVYSREAIMNSAYEFNIHVSDRTIDSHIRHIRAKFSAVGCVKIIETLHSVGYKLSSCQ